MGNPLYEIEYFEITEPKTIQESEWLNDVISKCQGNPVKISNRVNLELAVKVFVSLNPTCPEIVYELEDSSLISISNHQVEEVIRSKEVEFIPVSISKKSKEPKLELSLEEIWNNTKGETLSRIKQSINKLETDLRPSFLTVLTASEESKPVAMILISALVGKSDVLYLISAGKNIKLW